MLYLAFEQLFTKAEISLFQFTMAKGKRKNSLAAAVFAKPTCTTSTPRLRIGGGLRYVAMDSASTAIGTMLTGWGLRARIRGSLGDRSAESRRQFEDQCVSDHRHQHSMGGAWAIPNWRRADGPSHHSASM